MDRQVVDALLALPERNRFMKGLYAFVGFRAVPVPYQPEPRSHGRTHFGLARLLRLALDGLTAFTTWPLRAVSVAGYVLALLSFSYGAYLTLSYLISGNDVSGWTTIVVSLMLFAGIQLISLGVVGEYVGRIFEEVKARPLYIVRQSLGSGLEAESPVTPVMPGRPPGARRDLALALIVMLWLMATAWARPLMLPDEGRYVGVAWEMLRSGDWLTPTLDGLPYFHKPPLFYWLTAASMQLFGVHALSARAAPLLGAWVGALAVAAFVRRWRGERMARLTLLALLAQPFFYLGGQFANLDMLVAGCITATIVLAAHAVLCERAGLAHRRWTYAAYAAAALGVLAKGLIGGVLPVLVLTAWLAWRRDARGLRVLLSPGAGLLFLLVAAPWFVAMLQRHEGFLHYFFVVQHFQRYAGAGFNNAQPAWFYPLLLLLACLPWWPWLAALARRFRAPQGAPAAEVRILMLLWLLVIVAFFSLPRSKLIGYVLPAVPPLAALIAEGLAATTLPARLVRRLWFGGTAAAVALSLAVVVVLARTPLRSSREVATALLAARGGTEPVYLLGTYPFDLALLTRQRSPLVVFDAWDDPAIHQHDDWRKELLDAQAFASPQAQQVLQPLATAGTVLCRSPRAWVVAAHLAEPHALLRTAQLVMSTRELQLWRVDAREPATASALGCAQTPSADPR